MLRPLLVSLERGRVLALALVVGKPFFLVRAIVVAVRPLLLRARLVELRRLPVQLLRALVRRLGALVCLLRTLPCLACLLGMLLRLGHAGTVPGVAGIESSRT